MKRYFKKTKKDKNGLKDIILELIFWIPELLIYPIRLAILLVRGIGKLLHHIFDVI
ncbi:hypothetical protein [Halobacillus sp. Marseille-P3879]|uniref:hypothetical protein n=1 Tax=Halobacillus TaxID=45667 RepID=UPI00190EDEEF|nr:hypothetical protein [Halobacillus sp. Marseille-P3879]